MAKYVYPAIFTAEEGDLYSINFPDLERCYTSGEGLANAMEMAQDILAITLYRYESKGIAIPAPSKPSDIKCDKDSFVNLISADTLEYQKMFNNKAVKKTLSIPEWLNEAALKKNINFSQTLQDALIEKLDA